MTPLLGKSWIVRITSVGDPLLRNVEVPDIRSRPTREKLFKNENVHLVENRTLQCLMVNHQTLSAAHEEHKLDPKSLPIPVETKCRFLSTSVYFVIPLLVYHNILCDKVIFLEFLLLKLKEIDQTPSKTENSGRLCDVRILASSTPC